MNVIKKLNTHNITLEQGFKKRKIDAEVVTEIRKRLDRTRIGTKSLLGCQMRFGLQGGFPLLTTKKGGNLVKFAEKIKTDNDFAQKHGDLVDQLKELVENLKNSPFSRRHILTTWNPPEIKQMLLPPCHLLVQFFVSEKKELSCLLYQRSGDMFLGVPFNIASYSLLTMMIAQVCGYKLGEFIHALGDAHIYLNHFEQVKEQLTREPKKLPIVKLNPKIKSLFDFCYEDISLENYDPYPPIRAKQWDMTGTTTDGVGFLERIETMDQNYLIGKDNKLPWKIPAEMKYFSQITFGNAVLMGAKTFESIGKPLKNRLNIVITRNKEKYENWKEKNLIFTSNLREILKPYKENPSQHIFVIGGREIYQQTYSCADYYYVSMAVIIILKNKYMTTLQEYLNEEYPINQETQRSTFLQEIVVDKYNQFRNIDGGELDLILNCSNNQINSLNIKQCLNLTLLELYNNPIANFEIFGYDNNIEKMQGSLKLNNIPNLVSLTLPESKIDYLEVINCPKLQTINCYGNKLVDVKLEQLNNLTNLSCSKNQLKKIDLSGCPNLESLECFDNQLEKLDENKENEKLEKLDIASNNFPKQDLRFLIGLINLKVLKLGNNNQTKIENKIVNRFDGSLGFLKYNSKLVELDISHTNINSGLEYLPKSIERISLKFWLEEEIKEYEKLIYQERQLTIRTDGQTGVSRAVLDAALEHNSKKDTTFLVHVTGLEEDGEIPLHYPLIETEFQDYSTRTKTNILYADATLVLRLLNSDLSQDGTLFDIQEASKLQKECKIIYLDDKSILPGIYNLSFKFMTELLKKKQDEYKCGLKLYFTTTNSTSNITFLSLSTARNIKEQKYFITIAQVCALRSKDPNTQVGVVIVNGNKEIIATGYNGLP
ncbi:6767_t:CDS:10 [Entrophospora sp. SA101]|nr:6767_t:CDS:10 [Entrophospora sp. SA101]